MSSVRDWEKKVGRRRKKEEEEWEERMAGHVVFFYLEIGAKKHKK